MFAPRTYRPIEDTVDAPPRAENAPATNKAQPLFGIFATVVFAVACSGPTAIPKQETHFEEHAAPVPEGTPRLVLLIVVDQMRADYLERFSKLLPQGGGFKRLLNDGVVFANAHHFHAATETAPGHATLSTGVFPKRHGIVRNSWFDRNLGDKVYCCSPGLEEQGKPRSPSRLKARTLADRLKAVHNGAKVFAASAKDRAAILMGGHRADGAYWYNRTTGDWDTSCYYGTAESRPAWVDRFNAAGGLAHHFGTAWKPLLPPEDTSEYGIKPIDMGEKVPTFPHRLDGSNPQDPDFFSSIYDTPLIDSYLAQFVEDLITEERLGADEVPDLLAVSFSALDNVGHTHGPDAPETLDTLLRLDHTIGELLDFVASKVDPEHVVVALTADHGVGRVPESVTAEEGKGGRLAECIANARSHVEEKFSKPVWRNTYNKDTVYLNQKEITEAETNRTEVEEEIIKAVTSCPLVSKILRPVELDPSNHLHELYLNSYSPDRSPDLLIVPEPNVLFLSPDIVTASHGSPYGYDTHVPLIIRRQDGIGQVVTERANTIDLAPSLAAILGLELDGFDGEDRLANL